MDKSAIKAQLKKVIERPELYGQTISIVETKVDASRIEATFLDDANNKVFTFVATPTMALYAPKLRIQPGEIVSDYLARLDSYNAGFSWIVNRDFPIKIRRQAVSNGNAKPTELSKTAELFYKENALLAQDVAEIFSRIKQSGQKLK